jgi:hypothetical protein
MLFVIKFIIGTKDLGLKIDLKIFCDNDWAGDLEKRISVTGFVVYLFDIPICWRSKAQRNVKLLRNEAENISISEAPKEIRFIHSLLFSDEEFACQSDFANFVKD